MDNNVNAEKTDGRNSFDAEFDIKLSEDESISDKIAKIIKKRDLIMKKIENERRKKDE